MTRDELAEAAGVSTATIKRLESMDGELAVHLGTLRKLQAAFEAKGIAFIPENGGGPGVRLKS